MVKCLRFMRFRKKEFNLNNGTKPEPRDTFSVLPEVDAKKIVSPEIDTPQTEQTRAHTTNPPNGPGGGSSRMGAVEQMQKDDKDNLVVLPQKDTPTTVSPEETPQIVQTNGYATNPLDGSGSSEVGGDEQMETDNKDSLVVSSENDSQTIVSPEEEETTQKNQTNGQPMNQPDGSSGREVSAHEQMETDNKDSVVVSERSSGNSGNSKGSDSDPANKGNKNSTGRKTVAVIVGVQPSPAIDQDHKTRKGIIAPHAPFDTERKSVDLQIEKYDKDKASEKQIRKAITENEFLTNIIYDERLTAVVEAMSPQEFPEGSFIIRQGESGSHLFVSAYGEFQVIQNGRVINNFGAGEVFGELAIIYKAKRFASIRCVTEAIVWTLDRRVFHKIMVRSERQEHADNIRFLISVPLFEGMEPTKLENISEFLKREFFKAGTAVVRQDDHGDKFYIIRGGTVVVTKRDADGIERRVGLLKRGDYFGEQALLRDDRRLATVTAQPPGVECLTLERGPFKELLDAFDNPIITPAPPEIPRNSEYGYVTLKDLKIVGTMGVGGFGRVELVKYKPNPSLTFALKCLKKVDMVQQQQQEHAFNEKQIMMICNSPFICKLYKTFKDSKYIYFLMEPVLGGDVWSILHKRGFFPENVARFMAACVVEAFQYLHNLNIIYRDLKPENLMLDKEGYIKMVDFGFAKSISPNTKTWTFAGTPEYVAPEIVLNKGHDRAVDCWALGVLIHELLVGRPPFRALGGDHMKTYNLILRGIDDVAFHSRVPNSAQLLIKKLCRPIPAERLGYLRNGMQDVKNHKWYLGFDWEALRERKMKAPLIRRVANDHDLSNFEKYPNTDKMPPDETSGWDDKF